MSWPVAAVGDVCDVVGGGTPSKSRADFYGGSIPWASIRDMRGDWIESTEFGITDEAVASSATNVIPAGNVIIATRVGLGKVARLRRDTAINQDIRAVVPRDDTKLDKQFLFHWFKSISHIIEAEGKGATVKGVTLPFVKSLQLPLPSMSEQHRIVALLDEAFAGIATAKTNAEKNLRNAREIFEGQLQSVFGQCGSKWVVTTIGEVIRFIDYRGKTPIKTEAGLRLITAKNVKMGFVQREPEEFVAPDSYDAWMTRGIPLKGDVLFTTEAPCGNVAQLDTDEKVVFAQRIIIMQPDENRLDSTFLKYALLSSPLQKRIQAKATGATALGIKASLLRTIEFSFPKEVKEQLRIVATLDTLRDEVARLESLYTRKLAALDELKQSLLQRAFSGQL